MERLEKLFNDIKEHNEELKDNPTKEKIKEYNTIEIKELKSILAQRYKLLED